MGKAIQSVAVALVTGGILAGGGIFAADRAGMFADVAPNVRVGGRVVPRGASLGSWLDGLRARLGEREVAMSVEATYPRARLADLGVELDVAATMEAVRAASAGSLADRLRASVSGDVHTVDVPLVFRVDRAKASTYLATLAPMVHRDPVNAKLDLMNHLRIEDVPGAELDVATTLDELTKLPHEDGDVLPVFAKPLRAAVTAEDVAKVDVSKVLSAQETTFVTWGTGAGRAVNIQTAARKLDGTMLGPGETFSFNGVVGPRTLEAGFTYAPEIVGDELETGVGGGTCQVASTLHAAALFGAMEIVDRHSHGRPSSYTKMGLDATVAYGKVDLKIQNPYPFPVILHAYLPKPTAIRVEILGSDPQAQVEYKYGINRSDDFFRRITFKPFLPAGKTVRHQKGIRGFAVSSMVTVTYADGRVVEKSYLSDYRPVPEVFWVGPGVDENELPELPDGAKRVERRGLPDPAPPLSAPSSPSG